IKDIIYSGTVYDQKTEHPKLSLLSPQADVLRQRRRANRTIDEVPNCRVQDAHCGRNPRPTESKTRLFIGNFGGRKPVNSTASTGFMERAMGIEPTSEAWE